MNLIRTGFGAHLFHDWRFFDEKGESPNPDFILNFPAYKGVAILLAGESFGCESSREHVPWALTNYGFKVVIAPSFADIFYGNCFNNQLLPIALAESQIKELFEIDKVRSGSLLYALDTIGLTLKHEENIVNYEKHLPAFLR